MHIDCPHCGRRNVEEFEFRSVAPISAATAFERVYERVNLPDASVEHWQHVHGCRAWLVLRRDPSTGAVRLVDWLGCGS
jgi:heterotetrameric sarcosine oxidase delta subunit